MDFGEERPRFIHGNTGYMGRNRLGKPRGWGSTLEGRLSTERVGWHPHGGGWVGRCGYD